MNNDLIFILKKAVDKNKIKVTETTIREFILSHPNYPSFKCICDALKKWKIDYYALNLEINEIKDLEMPFIAHLKLSGGLIAYVEKIENEEVIYFINKTKRVKEKFEGFSKKLSGAVIVMEARNDSGEKNYSRNRQSEILEKSLLPLSVLAVLVYFVFNFINGVLHQPNLIHISLYFTKIIGLAASVFLVLHELKVETPIINKICGFNDKVNCDTVLSSNASKFFGWVNWADIGLIYFFGTLLYLAGVNNKNSLWLLALVSTLVLPYSIFSIYYQSVKLKTWCPFCVSVQSIFIVEFILLFPSLKNVSLIGYDFFRIIVVFLIPSIIWFNYRAYLKKAEEQKVTKSSYLQFKRNPDVFKALLQKDEYHEFPINKNSLILGNPNSSVTITAFLSLYCAPCAMAFKQLYVLLKSCPEIKINTIFSVYNNEEFNKLVSSIYRIYFEESSNVALDFIKKWYSTPLKERITVLNGKIYRKFDFINEIKAENKNLFKEYRINGTPTVYVNGYRFSNLYNYSDIIFFTDKIKDLTMEKNGQEAQVF